MPDHSRIQALGNVDLALARGENLVVVGRNGSGKTTLLQVLGGVLPHNEGDLRVEGRIASLIDLGAGIDPEFSGRDNAVLLGLLAGQSRREVIGRLEPIHEFSALEDAFDMPVKTYSNGMIMRLAFAAATACEPGILLIDEVLAVGDLVFQQRCLRRVRELRTAGCTTVLVTHDPAAATRFANRALWLDGGQVAAAGETATVLRLYLSSLYDTEHTSEDVHIGGAPGDPGNEPVAPALSIPHIDHRHGSGRAHITGIAVRDRTGAPVPFPEAGQPICVVVTARAEEPVAAPIVGFSMRDRLGEIVTATNTAHERRELPALDAGDELSVEFRLPWPPLAPGPFSLSPAIAEGDLAAHAMCDWIDNAIMVQSTNSSARYGTFSLEDVELAFSVQQENPS